MLRKTIGLGTLLIALMLVSTALVWAGGSTDVLKSKEIVYGNFWADWSVDSYQPANEQQEIWLQWRKSIQKDHGFKMKEKMVGDWGSMLPTLTTSIMAGRPAGHIFVVSPDWAMSLHRQKLLYPTSDSKAVNFKSTEVIPFKQPAYNQEIISSFTFNGKSYAFAVGSGGSGHAAGIFYNKRLFKEAGLDPDIPYNMQKAGTWTWDNYFDICKKLTRDRNNTGRIDTYAMTADVADQILDAFIFSNGAEWVSKDASGKFVNATGRVEFIEALQFCRRMLDEGLLMPRPEGSNWDWHFPMFHDGHTAMMVGADWQKGSLDSMADDWGWVFCPKGPRASDYRHPDDDLVIVVPITFKPDEVDFILKAFNLWVTPTNTDWKTDAYNAYRDNRAVDETSAMMRTGKYSVFRNNLMIPNLVTGDISWQMWWYDGDPAQLIESVSQNWNILINDANSIK
ncbi:MAG: extracellular solute-binding protein [Treponema sp.]|jgi:ABC-type glycerol-3-phosphate transport system substrate-binding protein|nr:extracellular solute-binding protein [Treponema sp.]